MDDEAKTKILFSDRKSRLIVGCSRQKLHRIKYFVHVTVRFLVLSLNVNSYTLHSCSKIRRNFFPKLNKLQFWNVWYLLLTKFFLWNRTQKELFHQTIKQTNKVKFSSDTCLMLKDKFSQEYFQGVPNVRIIYSCSYFKPLFSSGGVM